jgi:Ca2+/Na+ antiporter
MKDGGKLLLKIISVIFIIFGVIATVVSVIALITSTGLGTGWVIASIILLAASVIELIIGFMGLKKSDDPSQSNFFIVTGFVLGILMFVSMIMNFSAWNLIGFALPVLYIVGGYMMRSARA